MSNIVKKDGYSYSFDVDACSTCKGRCCTGESGYIYVTMTEIENISKLLNLEVKDFAQEYLFKKLYKYSIKENKFGESYECVFYDRESNGCKIYEARPLQCKTFPFWDYFKQRVDELKLECPGVIDV
ncbi:YkgJ family cysteine cluster protein [Candidatus Sulfurimonas baltica]|uniref:YkgJ family cysteine cluster protein n=1 Tax=Candidatus Sulfurimonas baltica TaxID=2740404 RepID=A0A7S7LTV2_9BACT|nr:YkgJ family cysteine cluster protein [Candidatus Sulfurimonas baltica]QOY51217.1 YkgJ family cysteine cluster protein [Candidatus Sulfurimonas baltica]